MKFKKLYQLAHNYQACSRALRHIANATSLSDLVDTPYFDAWLEHLAANDERIRQYELYKEYVQHELFAWHDYKWSLIRLCADATHISNLHQRYLDARSAYRSNMLTNRIILVQGLFNLLDLYETSQTLGDTDAI